MAPMSIECIRRCAGTSARRVESLEDIMGSWLIRRLSSREIKGHVGTGTGVFGIEGSGHDFKHGFRRLVVEGRGKRPVREGCVLDADTEVIPVLQLLHDFREGGVVKDEDALLPS